MWKSGVLRTTEGNLHGRKSRSNPSASRGGAPKRRTWAVVQRLGHMTNCIHVTRRRPCLGIKARHSIDDNHSKRSALDEAPMPHKSSRGALVPRGRGTLAQDAKYNNISHRAEDKSPHCRSRHPTNTRLTSKLEARVEYGRLQEQHLHCL